VAVYRHGMTYWYDFSFKKRRYRGSTRTKNHREAMRIIAAFRTALAKGDAGIFAKQDFSPTPTFAEFSATALKEIKFDSSKDSRTLEWYDYHYKQCRKFEPLATARLDKIDEKLLSEFRVHLCEDTNLSAPTVNGRLRAIRRALHIAFAWKIITRVPSFPVMSEKGYGREFILLPSLKPVFLGRSPGKYQAIFEFLLETGLRVGECVNLTWDRVFLCDIDEFGRPYIHLRPDRQLKISIKSKRSRRLPLFDRALEIIKLQQEISQSRFAFVQYGPQVRKERQFVNPFSRHDVSRGFPQDRQRTGPS
jgi:integrase